LAENPEVRSILHLDNVPKMVNMLSLSVGNEMKKSMRILDVDMDYFLEEIPTIISENSIERIPIKNHLPDETLISNSHLEDGIYSNTLGTFCKFHNIY